MICPDCGYENIDGVDTCEKCESSLNELTTRSRTVRSGQFSRTESICSSPQAGDHRVSQHTRGEVLQTLVKNGEAAC